MKTKTLFLSLLALVSLSACTTESDASTESSVTVNTSQAKEETIRSALEFSGTLEGVKESFVSSKIPGQIQTIEVGIGDKIKQGQILARLSGEENFTTRNTAYASYQNSLAHVDNTNFVMEQKIRNAEIALQTAKENLELIKNSDKNEDNISSEQIEKAELSLELLEVNLENLESQNAQKEKDILDSVLTSIDLAYILLGDSLSYLYSLNNESLSASSQNFDLHEDFVIKDSQIERLSQYSIQKFKNDYYIYKAYYEQEANSPNQSKENILLKRDKSEEILKSAKEALKNMSLAIADAVDHSEMPQSELDNHQRTLVEYNTQINNMLLSQDSGLAVGIVGVRQSLENLELETSSKRKELNKQIELAHNQVNLLKSTINGTKDDLESRVRIAEQGVAEAEEAVQEAKKQKDLQVQMVKTEADARRGSLNIANVQAANNFLKAPYDGVVTEKLSEQGVVIDAGMPIFKVADVSSYKIVIYVPEKQIRDIQVGQTAIALLESYQDEKLKARVERISPKTEEETKKVRLELSVEKKDYLKIGMQAKIVFDIENEQEILTIKKEDSQKVYDDYQVQVIEDSQISLRTIKVKEHEEYLEVLDGLSKEDKIVSPFNSDLKNSDSVNIN